MMEQSAYASHKRSPTVAPLRRLLLRCRDSVSSGAAVCRRCAASPASAVASRLGFSSLGSSDRSMASTASTGSVRDSKVLPLEPEAPAASSRSAHTGSASSKASVAQPGKQAHSEVRAVKEGHALDWSRSDWQLPLASRRLSACVPEEHIAGGAGTTDTRGRVALPGHAAPCTRGPNDDSALGYWSDE